MKNIANVPIGRLTPKHVDTSKPHKRTHWLCECACGDTKIVAENDLIRTDGRAARSCGCINRERLRAMQPKATAARAKQSYLGPGVALRNFLFYKYRKSAAKRKLSFTVDRATFDKITSAPCYYCGSIPSQTLRIPSCPDTILYNGIDRTNSNLGYDPGNIRPCCWTCNAAKAQMTDKQFCDWIRRIHSVFALSFPK